MSIGHPGLPGVLRTCRDMEWMTFREYVQKRQHGILRVADNRANGDSGLLKPKRTASRPAVEAPNEVLCDDWDRFYDCLISIGRTSEKLATVLLELLAHKLLPDAAELEWLDEPAASRPGWIRTTGRFRRTIFTELTSCCK